MGLLFDAVKHIYREGGVLVLITLKLKSVLYNAVVIDIMDC